MAVVATMTMPHDDIIPSHNVIVDKKYRTTDASIKNFGGIENQEGLSEIDSEELMQLLSSDVSCTSVRSFVAKQIRAGANLQALLSQTNSMGWQPLLIAAQRNAFGVLEALVDLGADLECQDPSSGWTPLMYAVVNGNTRMVELLVAKQANINKFAKDGWNPLSAAVEHEQEAIIDVLLNAGACLQTLKRRNPHLYEQYRTLEQSHQYGTRRTASHMLPTAHEYGMRRGSCNQLPF